MKTLILGLMLVSSVAMADQLTPKQIAEDRALEADIHRVAAMNPQIDFSAKDAEGKSLEYRVLEHAQELGTPDYELAFQHLMKYRK